jgi:hypothetical protein
MDLTHAVALFKARNARGARTIVEALGRHPLLLDEVVSRETEIFEPEPGVDATASFLEVAKALLEGWGPGDDRKNLTWARAFLLAAEEALVARELQAAHG